MQRAPPLKAKCQGKKSSPFPVPILTFVGLSLHIPELPPPVLQGLPQQLPSLCAGLWTTAGPPSTTGAQKHSEHFGECYLAPSFHPSGYFQGIREAGELLSGVKQDGGIQKEEN